MGAMLFFFFLKEAFLISTYDHGFTRLSFRLTFLVSQLVAESRSITFWGFLNSKKLSLMTVPCIRPRDAFF